MQAVVRQLGHLVYFRDDGERSRVRFSVVRCDLTGRCWTPVSGTLYRR